MAKQEKKEEKPQQQKDKKKEVHQPDQSSEMEQEIDEDEINMINEQFEQLYNKDPELKQALGNDPSAYSVQEKYSILNAYAKGQGV